MGYQCQLRCCELVDQHALRHVVSNWFGRSSLCSGSCFPRINRHASIDPVLRAARGLPEDLIRLCVGIEDPNDLIDDLEVALLQAGAIKSSGTTGHVRSNPTYNPRAHQNVLNKAIEKLADHLGAAKVTEEDDRNWMVSAPGKVILFGEHAVVHGVVSPTTSPEISLTNLFV